MYVLLHAHSGIRYLILVAAVAVVGYALYGMVGGREFDERMRKLGGIFAGLMHLNILVGVGLLFVGRFYPQLAGHVFMMVFAAVAAQIVPSVMRRRPMEERTFAPYIVSTIVSLGLLWAGLAAIGRGMV